MSLHKHEPVPEKTMEVESPVNSICEVLRKIYHKTDDDEIKLNSRIAVSMAKSMSNRMVELSGKKNWFKDYWDKNIDYTKGRMSTFWHIIDSKHKIKVKAGLVCLYFAGKLLHIDIKVNIKEGGK